MRYFAAGLLAEMLPAGEMWSVVTESPRTATQRAPTTSVMATGLRVIFSKKGGRRTYVEAGAH
jgi:hypothetical protein